MTRTRHLLIETNGQGADGKRTDVIFEFEPYDDLILVTVRVGSHWLIKEAPIDRDNLKAASLLKG